MAKLCKETAKTRDLGMEHISDPFGVTIAQYDPTITATYRDFNFLSV